MYMCNTVSSLLRLQNDLEHDFLMLTLIDASYDFNLDGVANSQCIQYVCQIEQISYPPPSQAHNDITSNDAPEATSRW